MTKYFSNFDAYRISRTNGTDTMENLNYDKFSKALRRLEERYSDFQNSFNRNELFESDREALAESCIQRFETCFDTSWKHLKKYLESEIGLSDLPNGPRPIFRIAGENFLIDSVENWIDYNQKRIDTAHDYSEEKATETLSVIPNFIKDAIDLYQKLSGEAWQRSSK